MSGGRRDHARRRSAPRVVAVAVVWYLQQWISAFLLLVALIGFGAWRVADVLFRDDECDEQLCYVQPLYLDPNTKTPILTTSTIVTQTYGPPYPPVPP